MIALVYNILREMAARPRAQEETVAYLAECLNGIVKKRDTVLICFPEQGEDSLSQVMEQAVLRCEASPVVWGADHRWKSLLRLAFSSRAATIISTPLIVLGLAKLRSFYSIPLFVRNVVTSGYPCEEWMIDGIRRGFDCDSWGCFGIGTTDVVAGFSCDAVRGIHIRDEKYRVEIVDPHGNRLPEGEDGEIVLSPVEAPEIRYFMGENARLHTDRCVCGSIHPRLTNIRAGRTEADADLLELGQMLQSWSSVLDCCLRKGQCGLELELIVLPGGRLPKLPTAAKQRIRVFNPETDAPLPYDPTQKIPENGTESH